MSRRFWVGRPERSPVCMVLAEDRRGALRVARGHGLARGREYRARELGPGDLERDLWHAGFGIEKREVGRDGGS